MPQRIQRKRTKGWRMPEGAVYVGRPTKWGNPYHVGQPGTHTRGEAVEMFRVFMENPRCEVIRMEARRALRGKDLACWCPLDQPCHADVLLELANRER